MIPGDVENVTEYYVFRVKDLGNDDFELEDIDDEEEYDAAAMLMKSVWIHDFGIVHWKMNNR